MKPQKAPPIVIEMRRMRAAGCTLAEIGAKWNRSREFARRVLARFRGVP